MPESELSQESIELARLQEAYGGKYVAARGDKVVASAANLGELFQSLDARGDYTEDVVIRHVRPKGQICVY